VLNGTVADERGRQPIRNIAVGLLVRQGHVLAEEHPLIEGHHGFVRAIGGGIEFGERAAEALRREFREELGVTLESVELLDVSESLFTILDRPGHEIVHIFGISCPELAGLPLDERLRVLDSDASVGWYALRDLAREEPPFYPAGVLAAARGLAHGP
jgi:8-oxo-dGTP pyrophosphatase MutT (NUDIX family)